MVNFGNKFANNNNNIPKPESPEIPQENNIHSDGFTRYAGYDDAQKLQIFILIHSQTAYLLINLYQIRQVLK